MRMSIRLGCGLLACLMASSIHAEELGTDDPRDEWMKYMVGTWTWTTPTGGVGELTFSKDESAPILIGRGKGDAGTWIIVWAKHDDTGDIVEHIYGSDGGHSTTRLTIDDQGALAGDEQGWGPNGISSMSKKLEKVDKDNFAFRAVDSVVGGEAQEDMEIAVKRK